MTFTQNTIENIQFLKNNYSLDPHKPNIKYTLRRIHNAMNKIHIKHHSYVEHSNVAVVENSSLFFPSVIVNYINKTRFREYIFKIHKQNYRFMIKLYSETSIHIKEYIKKIKTIIVMFIRCKPSLQKTYNNITIYLTDFEKTKEYMNTGFTYGNNIVLYRKEEWFKVFIHECIHLFDFDFHNHNDFSKMKQYFPIQSQFLLFETYTEFWARIINISWLSRHKSFRIFEHRFHKYFKREQLYACLMTNKLLNEQNLTYQDLLQHNNHYQEKTNIFCYVILTSLLFFHIQETMDFFESEHLFHYEKSVDQIMNFIIHLHKKDKWLHHLDQINYVSTTNRNMALYDIK